MEFCLVWVLSDTVIGVGLNAHLKESYRLLRQASEMRRSFPTKSGDVMKNKYLCVHCTNSMAFEIKLDIISQLPLSTSPLGENLSSSSHRMDREFTYFSLYYTRNTILIKHVFSKTSTRLR